MDGDDGNFPFMRSAWTLHLQVRGCEEQHFNLKPSVGTWWASQSFIPFGIIFLRAELTANLIFSGPSHISMPLLNCHGHRPIGTSWKTGFVWRSQIFEASCGYSHG